MHRRSFLHLGLAAAATACSRGNRATPRGDGAPAAPPAPAAPAPAASPAAATAPTPEATTMLTRPIPRTQEALPVIGLGTWQTFDVDARSEQRDALADVLRGFLAAGGRVIDSSPMYGEAEARTGDLLAAIGAAGTPFLATKVWTTGEAAGRAQIRTSMQRMRTERLDLLQIHNLLDWKTHLPVLRELKAAGTIRYLGVTHYARGAFDDLERLMRTEQLDFVQLPYNLADRAAEARLLPAARDTGTAVLVMRPFAEGELFARFEGQALPDWAAEIDCASWAQLFLKFILGHPAVNCPLPATRKPHHLADNVRAGSGRLPDEAMRTRMVALLDR